MEEQPECLEPPDGLLNTRELASVVSAIDRTLTTGPDETIPMAQTMLLAIPATLNFALNSALNCRPSSVGNTGPDPSPRSGPAQHASLRGGTDRALDCS